jgi:hypothetical protein
MPKNIDQWALYKFIAGEFMLLSRPFNTKKEAEKARLKYSERERGRIGVGVIRK